jgi:hypothetical protein
MRGSLLLICLVTVPLTTTAGAAGTIIEVSDRTDPIIDKVCGGTPHTLRWAVAHADDGDEVRLTRELTFQLNAECGPITTTKAITIRGCTATSACDGTDPAKVVVKGSGRRLFSILADQNAAPGSVVTFSHLTLTGGEAHSSKGERLCGDSVSGGAICNASERTLHIERVILDHNLADRGGAVATSSAGATIEIVESTLRNNTADEQGGAVFVRAGTLSVERSTLNDNTAGTDGGGIYAELPGSVSLTNVTLSSNTAAEGVGGGLFLQLANGLIGTVKHATIAGNTAKSGAGGVAVIVTGDDPPQLAVENSVLSDNTPTQCSGAVGTPAGTKNAVAKDASDHDACATALGVAAVDATAIGFGALTDNGGPTQTRLPGASDGNPALNQTTGACECKDQRGEVRGVKSFAATSACSFQPSCPPGACDLGAVEIVPDGDHDGVPDYRDNCLHDANPGQEDKDGDCIGDACDCLSESPSTGGERDDDDRDGIQNGADCCDGSQATLLETTNGSAFVLAVAPSGCTVEQSCSCEAHLFAPAAGSNRVTRARWDHLAQWKKCIKGGTSGTAALTTVEDGAHVGRTTKAERKALRRSALSRYERPGCPVLHPGVDRDSDGAEKGDDNCPRRFNPNQGDCDRDRIGNLCDDDADGDGIPNHEDRCPGVPSGTYQDANGKCGHLRDHKDADHDGVGDACDCCRHSTIHADVDTRGCERGVIPGERGYDAKRAQAHGIDNPDPAVQEACGVKSYDWRHYYDCSRNSCD